MAKSRTAAKESSSGKRQPPPFPKLYKVDDEMRRLSAMLTAEVSAWPGVTLKPMFGFSSLYREKKIFASVPQTRAMYSARSVIFKLPEAEAASTRPKNDERIHGSQSIGKGWFGFELREPSDVTDALQWFSQAYEQAKPRSR